MKVLVIKNAVEEGAGSLLKYMKKRGISWATVELSLGEQLPSDIVNIGAVVVLGGPMSVHDHGKFPFLKQEEEFIRHIVSKHVPFLGICLGAQLLAKTFGGDVYTADKKEVGWYNLDLTKAGKADKIFASLQKNNLDVFQWHADTFNIPDGGILLAKGRPVLNQAFKIGTNAYGFQFHIEAEHDKISEWFDDDPKKEHYLSQLERLRTGYDKTAFALFENFLNMSSDLNRSANENGKIS